MVSPLTSCDLVSHCPLYPGGGGARTAGDRPRPPPAASQRPAPVTLDCDPSQDVMITRHQQGFTVVHPTPAFPSPVTPDGTGILGLSPELHTQLSRTQQRMSGRGGPGHCPDYVPGISQPPSTLSLTTCDLTSQRSIIMSPGQRPSPADPGKAVCFDPAPGRHGWYLAQEGQQP